MKTTNNVWKARKEEFLNGNDIRFEYCEMFIEILHKNDAVVIVADGFECCKVDDINEAIATVKEW